MGLPVEHDAPDAYKQGKGEMEEEQWDHEAFAPWRVYARRTGDGCHGHDVGLEVLLGSN